MACRSLGKFFVFPNKYYLSLKRTYEPPLLTLEWRRFIPQKICNLKYWLWSVIYGHVERTSLLPSPSTRHQMKKNGAYIEKHVYIWQPLSIFLEITVRARLRPKSGQLVWQNKCLKHRQTVFCRTYLWLVFTHFPPGDLPEIMKTDSHKLTLRPGETLARL